MQQMASSNVSFLEQIIGNICCDKKVHKKITGSYQCQYSKLCGQKTKNYAVASKIFEDYTMKIKLNSF